MDCESLSTTTNSTIPVSQLQELCRLCANTDNQLMDIFNGEGLEHDIAKKIEKHIPIIKVTETDQLPLQVCYQCASTLIAWHTLYEGCAAADKRLREIVSIEDKQILDFDRDDHIASVDATADTTLNEKFASKTNDDEKARWGDASTSNNPSNATLSYQDDTTPVFDADSYNASYPIKIGYISSTSTKNNNCSDNSGPKVAVEDNSVKLHSEMHGSLNQLQFERGSKKNDQTSSNSSTNLECMICFKLCLTKRGLNRHSAAKHPTVRAHEHSSQKLESIDTEQTLVNQCHENLNALLTEKSASTDSECKEQDNDDAAADSGRGEPDNFKCSVCDRNFQEAESLRRHIHNGHRRQEKRDNNPLSQWYVDVDGKDYLKCDKCVFNTPAHNKLKFNEHYRIHTGERPFTCGECNKMFRTKTLVKSHIKHVHQDIREHSCDICGRKFSVKRFAIDHRRIHTGERPYVCDLCGKTFIQRASLFIHQELHKGLRKHACPLCSRRFTTTSSLSMHVKRHKNERNFVCATCGKAFIDGKQLREHMTVHSDERPFKCDICSRAFKLTKHMKQHRRTHQRDLRI